MYISFDHRVCFLRNIFGKRSDLPFSLESDRKKDKSVVSFTHEQNITCSQTIHWRRMSTHALRQKSSGRFPAKSLAQRQIPRETLSRSKKKWQLFLSVVMLWFCCHCERSIIILVEIFSDMYCLVDNAPWNFQTNTLARSIYPRSALRSLDARRGHAKKVGNFLHLCLMQVSCNSVQQEILQHWQKNSWALFWYMNLYRVARKRQFCKTRRPFLCYKSTRLCLQLDNSLAAIRLPTL